jgi:hypothetical protein
MTLQTAILIGLDNSEIVRVISFGVQGIPHGSIEPIAQKAGATTQASDGGPAPIVIARLNADASLYRFKTEVMAHLRSIEQQYWALASAQVQLRAADQVVSLRHHSRADSHAGASVPGDRRQLQAVRDREATSGRRRQSA